MSSRNSPRLLIPGRIPSCLNHLKDYKLLMLVVAVGSFLRPFCKSFHFGIIMDLDPSTSTIEYICTTAEKLVEEGRQFDAVMALEVIEHVAEPAEFCKSLAALTRPGGAIVISTINRSMRAYAAAIVAAEYILHWLPRGTHQWSSFFTPEELAMILKRSSINVEEMAGFALNPLTRKWILCDDLGVNFIAFATKNVEHEGQEEFISSREEPSSIAK
ncbi:Ubiquinone biosynthesis O-methyltransferase, mitochondrial [Linum perenne]